MRLSKMVIFYIIVGAVIIGAFTFSRIKNSDFFAKKENKYTTQTIEYQTVNEPSSILPMGISYIKQEGRNGEKTTTFLLIYNDKGQVKKQKILGEKVTIPVIDKVIVVGQKPLDEFSKGIREKAQDFYNNYKDGKYTGASKWLKFVSGADKMPYSDDTIRDAIKDIDFKIKEITVGEPKIQLPYNTWGNPYKSLNEVQISADIPLQVRSSSKLSVERVVNFTKPAYFNVVNNEWLFPPIGPVLFAPGSETVHFSPSANDEKGVGGIIRVSKVVQWVPMADTSSYNNFGLVLVFDTKFDNEKKVKRVNFDNVRDDLGDNSTYSYRATPYSIKDDSDSPQVDMLWAYVDTELKNVTGAKKLSLRVNEVSDDPVSYVFGGGLVVHPKDFTITGISIN